MLQRLRGTFSTICRQRIHSQNSRSTISWFGCSPTCDPYYLYLFQSGCMMDGFCGNRSIYDFFWVSLPRYVFDSLDKAVQKLSSNPFHHLEQWRCRILSSWRVSQANASCCDAVDRQLTKWTNEEKITQCPRNTSALSFCHRFALALRSWNPPQGRLLSRVVQRGAFFTFIYEHMIVFFRVTLCPLTLPRQTCRTVSRKLFWHGFLVGFSSLLYFTGYPTCPESQLCMTGPRSASSTQQKWWDNIIHLFCKIKYSSLKSVRACVCHTWYVCVQCLCPCLCCACMRVVTVRTQTICVMYWQLLPRYFENEYLPRPLNGRPHWTAEKYLLFARQFTSSMSMGCVACMSTKVAKQVNFTFCVKKKYLGRCSFAKTICFLRKSHVHTQTGVVLCSDIHWLVSQERLSPRAGTSVCTQWGHLEAVVLNSQLMCHTTLLPHQGVLASTANFKYSKYFYNN